MKDEYEDDDPYEVNLKEYFHKKRLENTLKLLRSISNNSLILDIGCRRGYFTKYFGLNNNKVIGIDYSRKAIDFAKRNFSSKNCQFRSIEVSNLVKLNKKFDIIIMNNLFEHVQNPTKLLSDCNKLLNKGGYVIISTPNLYSLQNIITLIALNKVRYRSKYHICEYTKSQIKHFLSNNSFKLEKLIPQYEINYKKGLKYRVYNQINYLIGFLRLSSLACTYFYLGRKENE